MRLYRLIPAFALSTAMTFAGGLFAETPQVSKTFPEASVTGVVLPAMQHFGRVASSATARPNAEIAQDFLALEFQLETGRSLATLTRFEGPITVALTGTVPRTARAEMTKLINRFRNEAGLNIGFAKAGDNASITIQFLPRAQMQRAVPSAACFVVPNVQSFADYKAARGSAAVDWTHVTQRQQVAIFVPSDTSPQEIRDCLNEETAQAMGPLNDLYHLPDSVFNDDNFNSVLTGFDMLMLRLHYAPQLHSGMSRADVAAVVPGLLAKMNPTGRGGSADRLGATPKSWEAAVEGAFGPRGSLASRRTSAAKMLSIARAQGWGDARLAFSYYADGRALAGKEPAQAVDLLNHANRIYAGIPGAQVHMAHVDMQLAAIALAAGDAAQAAAYADRAIPVARRAENAALLATLMLVKAEALESQGDAAKARALRLDSLGWARYGFGPEVEVRAREAEIAALGTRGRKG
jgi:hypothetical protein